MTLKQHKLTDAMIEAGVEAAEKQFWENVSEHDVRAIYLAMHQASIPTEATGDDMEQLDEATVRRAYEHFQHHAEAPCSASAMREAIELAIATLSPNSVIQADYCGIVEVDPADFTRNEKATGTDRVSNDQG